MNMDTLEARLSYLIKGRPGNNHNQRHQQLVNSSSSIGTMIPTPGMSHCGNSSLMVTSSVDSSMIAASGCNTIAPTTVNSGSLLSTGGIQSNSYNRSDGNIILTLPSLVLVAFPFLLPVLQSVFFSQEPFLMDINNHLPIFPLVLVETCHQWASKELQVK